MQPAAPLTREIFGNVSEAWQYVFYALALVSMGVLVWGVLLRARLWRLGKPVARPTDWKAAAINILRFVVLQRRVRGRGLASVAHGLLFGGFCTLFLGTVLIAVEHGLAVLLRRPAGSPVFHKGAYFAVFEVVLDTAGLALLAGCALFMYFRLTRRNARRRNAQDGYVLGLFIAIGVTGYIVEGLRIVREQTPLPGFSFVGYALASFFEMLAVSQRQASAAHLMLWWFHAALSLVLIAVFPWTRLLHALAGALRLAAGIEQLGAVTPVNLEEVAETGEIGAAHLQQLSRRQLLELDACVSCGRCEQACPATEAGKPLSPLDVVQDIRQHLQDSRQSLLTSDENSDSSSSAASLPGKVVAEESIWSCTACSACVDVCPLGVSPLGLITDMRRSLVADSRLRGAPAVALERTSRSKNPWGMSAHDRLAWAMGLDVPTVATNPGFEVLYWVGCAAAYDPRLQRVARSVVRLLVHAKVNFAVLGPDERCNGETARRMGDELLFHQLASENIATFERWGLTRGEKTILAHCPHCVNSFRLDYPQLGAKLRAIHHTEFLAELVKSGRLIVPPGSAVPGSVTYHDPCYLARVWDVADAPRDLLSRVATKEALVEMPRHGRNTSCCGAGGGRMWFDDAPETRTGRSRVTEALATGAATLAVACPFCLTMTTDGVAAQGGAMEVRDVAEILAAAIFQEVPQP